VNLADEKRKRSDKWKDARSQSSSVPEPRNGKGVGVERKRRTHTQISKGKNQRGRKRGVISGFGFGSIKRRHGEKKVGRIKSGILRTGGGKCGDKGGGHNFYTRLLPRPRTSSGEPTKHERNSWRDKWSNTNTSEAGKGRRLTRRSWKVETVSTWLPSFVTECYLASSKSGSR